MFECVGLATKKLKQACLLILLSCQPSGQLEGTKGKWRVGPFPMCAQTLSCICYLRPCPIDQTLPTYVYVAAREGGKGGQWGGHLPR